MKARIVAGFLIVGGYDESFKGKLGGRAHKEEASEGWQAIVRPRGRGSWR
jgi:hypothetical protein